MKKQLLQIRTFWIFIALFGSLNINAQLNVAGNSNANALVQQLVGPGVTFSNATLDCGGATASGTFSNGNNTNIGINNGILLTNGDIANAVGPNNAGAVGTSNSGGSDPDLVGIVGGTISDACVLEFDFIPNGTTFSFNYVFGSEEYLEYVGTQFNDVFAFFLTGPNPMGGTYATENIALLTGTNIPVSINNVNNVNNNAFFINNAGGTTIQYDGFTTILTAQANVVPCQTYRIKLAIGDASDSIIDSGVFLEEGTFNSQDLVTAVVTNVSCPGGSDGSINTTPQLAGLAYTYMWSNGATTPNRTGLTDGNYSLTVTAGACMQVFQYVVGIGTDTEPPTAICQSVTLQLDVTGTAFLFAVNTNNPVMGFDNGSFDNCDLAQFPFTLSKSTFTCDDLGTQSVTLTVTDAAGNSADCMADVTVEDNVPPQVVCATVNLQLDANGNAILNPNDAVFAINEACGPNTVTASQTAFNCMNVTNFGIPNIVNIQVTDGSGNMGFCNANIFVFDEILPTALCDNVTVILNEFGSGNTTPMAVGGNSFDNCTIANIQLSQTNFMCADVGNNPVILTVTDNSNNMSTCDATVTVIDQTPPTPTCMPHQAELDANGIATINLGNVLASATDNCGVVPGGQVTQDAFNCAELGANIVTVSVTDVNGLTGSCQTTVTVVDLIDPTALCQDLTIDLDANGFAAITADQIDAGSNDNCNMITLAASPNTFFCGNVGVNPVTLIVTDQSQNFATCTANVTVRDLIPPVALCQDATLFLDENGEATLATSDIDNGSNDACGIASLVLNKTDFDCSNIGNSNPVVLTVTDVNGNVSTCDATVVVVDLMPAVILCRAPVNTVNDPGVCGANVLLLPPLILEENCSIEQVLNSAPAFFPLGTTTVTWVILDAGNNPTTCQQNVTINDTEAPVIDCGNSFTAFTSWNNCGYPSSLLEGATATDNCGIASITDDAPFFFEPGQYMVNYTATDFSGNTSTCMQWVKIYDTTLPKLISCPGDQLATATTDDGGNVTWPAPTAMDNCAGDIIWISSHESGDFFPLGETEVTYTGYDVNGNSVECIFMVKVIPAPQPLTMTCLETIEISTQSDVSLQTIAWNSPLVQSLCEDCEILKSDDFDYVGGFEGHNYYLFNSAEMTWNQARQLATNLGGYLTVINSEKENYFLATELDEDTKPWIGLADVAGNGIVGWADGSDFENPTWQEDFTLLFNTPTAFTLNRTGAWEIQPTDVSSHFLFEIPCYELEMTTDNDLNLATPNSETMVTYEITDQCGHTTTCNFQLVFTEDHVDYCEEGAIVTDSASQHFINQFFIVDQFYNESGNDYGYGDFTDEYLELTPGEILDIYADFGPLDEENPLYCRIWIDLNADGDFYDEGELIGQAIDVLNMQDELTVPNVSADITETRLRIAISRYGYPEPCGAYGNGEMEDYTITFNHENDPAFMMVNLQGQREAFSAKLSWVTQTNRDIDHYDIERSMDGVTFEKIEMNVADVTTKGTPEMYNDKDASPELGFNFYRLEVFPTDGEPFYSNVVSMKFNDAAQRMTVYPNPADEYVMLHVEGAEGKTATLQLFNVLGQQMQSLSFDELTGEDIRIDLDRLVDGNYYLHLSIDGQRPAIQKLVVDKLNGYRPAEK